MTQIEADSLYSVFRLPIAVRHVHCLRIMLVSLWISIPGITRRIVAICISLNENEYNKQKKSIYVVLDINALLISN